MLDISSTILAKSNQLNAEDLMSGPKVLKITNVDLDMSQKQPVSVHYEGGEGRPFKPCKGMRNVLSSLWSPDASQWIGRSVRVYMDPTAVFQGKETNGTRINGASDIECNKNVTISESRYRKVTYLVEKIEAVEQKQRPVWPDDKFNAVFEKMKLSIETGKADAPKIIAHLQKTADVTDAQKARLEAVTLATDQSDDEFFNEGVE
jgi:hypothetical protein